MEFLDHNSHSSSSYASSSTYESREESGTNETLIDSISSISHQMEDDQRSVNSDLSEESYQGMEAEDEDNLPKSFLALKGISVANFNMGCNFQVTAALQLTVRYEIYILTIQEHTPWNKELSQIEITHVHKICEKYGYFAIITKMQILIFDKQLSPCYQETKIHLQGRMLCSTLVIAKDTLVDFVAAMYGYPLSPKNQNNPEIDYENIIRGMRELSQQLKTTILDAQKENKMIYIHGDLQDTPDGSANYRYGSTQIAQHPLGIAKTCENLGLN